MFGSPILDVAIGLVLVYLLLSIIASSAREWCEAFLRSRAAQLEHGVRELLADKAGTDLATAMYEHPLIASLYRGAYDPIRMTKGRIRSRHSDLPSYIPKENFALALIDIVVRGADPTSPTQASARSPKIELGTVRAQIGSIQNPAVQRALLTALDTAAGDLDRFRRNVEDWFDSSMDRVSGWYKRETQHILLGIGLLLAVGGNVDSIALGRYLYNNKAARDAIVAEASVVSRDSTSVSANMDRVARQLDSLQLPIGWTHRTGSRATQQWDIGRFLEALFGWLLTAFAVSFGAPFWFDMLNKIMVVRSTVKPKEKSGDEGSKDQAGFTQSSPLLSATSVPPLMDAQFVPHEWSRGGPETGVL
jgi:hypothetical protein